MNAVDHILHLLVFLLEHLIKTKHDNDVNMLGAQHPNSRAIDI